MLRLMLSTYLEQLESAAAAAAVDLAEACKQEGVATTTLQRWRKGEVAPREGTAKALFARIEQMKRAQSQHRQAS
jgi:predicted site-specific integrase-resolvase